MGQLDSQLAQPHLATAAAAARDDRADPPHRVAVQAEFESKGLKPGYHFPSFISRLLG
jgi:hypothetical protein